MDINTFMSLVGSVGFPIVLCFYLIRFMETEQKEMRETINELKIAITKLTAKIEEKEEVAE